MDISELIAKRDSLIGEFVRSVTAAKGDAAALARPVALREARVEALTARIAFIETRRDEEVARAMARIAAIRSEIDALEREGASDRKLLAPVLNAKTGGKDAAVRKRAPTKPRGGKTAAAK